MSYLPKSPCVHLLDDEPPVRAALEFLLASHGLPVCSYDTGPALLTGVSQPAAARGCILLDVRMEPMSGLQVHDELMARHIELPVIFLTGHGDISMAVAALKKGAFDFVEKPFGDAALVDRVREAMAVDEAHQSRLAAGDVRGAKLAGLTHREKDVASRVAAGKLNKVIADEMNVSMRTVEVYRARVYAKLDVRSSAELATLLAITKSAL
ncbi:response regulator transcription factor [Rhodoferax sp. PAMC 29310]|uniref:response regulator transcription factor n=1 Tax=Rhodoferax sp. PAMC 29310 TaxID=2822760 RepID=UPI001B3340A5|nr:response regulator [Rhodoferax sp. PAMC 29310]